MVIIYNNIYFLICDIDFTGKEMFVNCMKFFLKKTRFLITNVICIINNHNHKMLSTLCEYHQDLHQYKYRI